MLNYFQIYYIIIFKYISIIFKYISNHVIAGLLSVLLLADPFYSPDFN